MSHLSRDGLAQALTNEVQRRLRTESILTDLIAGLRRHPDVAVQCAIYKLLDRAEARLEEVQGE